jgi:RHS repeat-associated protein
MEAIIGCKLVSSLIKSRSLLPAWRASWLDHVELPGSLLCAVAGAVPGVGRVALQQQPPIPTSFRYTGQRAEDSIKLYWYNARWYDPYLTPWASPDTIISDPYNPQDV